MAKKKKQKKAGIAKRQKSKLERKNAAKRRLQAMKTPQRRISPAKVKQNLKNLPNLIYEPELESIAFSAEAIRQVMSEHEKTPDQIEALATEAFMEKLLAGCQAMRIRFEREKNADKSMMVHAILYFMEQESAPAFLNQIVVAMFYQAQYQLENPGRQMELKELNQILRQYDETWSAYLQEKIGDSGIGNILQNVQGSPVEAEIDEEATVETTALQDSPFEPVVEEFGDFLSSELSLDDDARDRAVEDVEVLVNDYCEEKEISELTELQARKIRNFLEGWFVRVMNPTRDDMEAMIHSLELFYRFTAKTGKLPAETCDDVLNLLQDREALLAGFNG